MKKIAAMVLAGVLAAVPCITTGKYDRCSEI